MKKENSLYEKLNNIEAPEKMRDACVNEWLIPVAKKMLEDDQNLNCVCVAVAQYWNDEANNSVHIVFVPSPQKYSTWKNLFDPDKNELAKKDIARDYGDEREQYKMEWHPYGYQKEAEKIITGSSYFGMGNDEIFIASFEHLCKEGGDQENSCYENYTPIIIVNREDKKLKVRSLIDVIRIWG